MESNTAAKMHLHVPNIEDSFEKLQKYPSVTERYFTQYFYLNKHGHIDEHHCVLMHSNQICMVTLAPSHPIVENKKRIKKIDFQVSNKLDRLENKVTGKGKKGGQYIHPDSVLGFIECEDGSKYSIYGCIKGKLIEINQSLLQDYNLLVEKPYSQGYVAIILPNKKDIAAQMERLLDIEQYKKEAVSLSL